MKRVIDYNVKPRVKADGTGVDLANVKMSMNPFDEIAVEEAIRLKEKGAASPRSSLSAVGPAKAAGNAAHRPRHGRRPRDPRSRPTSEVEPLGGRQDSSRRSADEEAPGLVILGKQSISDDDSNQTGQMLAALMGRPSGQPSPTPLRLSTATALSVKREVDGGLQTVKRHHASCDRHHRPCA